MKIKELRELSVEELIARGRELRKEILNARVQQAAGQLENSARLNLLRKEVARTHTLVSQRRLGLSTPAPSAKKEKAVKKSASRKKAAE